MINSHVPHGLDEGGGFPHLLIPVMLCLISCLSNKTFHFLPMITFYHLNIYPNLWFYISAHGWPLLMLHPSELTLLRRESTSNVRNAPQIPNQVAHVSSSSPVPDPQVLLRKSSFLCLLALSIHFSWPLLRMTTNMVAWNNTVYYFSVV